MACELSCQRPHSVQDGGTLCAPSFFSDRVLGSWHRAPHRRVVDWQRRSLACPCWLKCARWSSARKVVEKDLRCSCAPVRQRTTSTGEQGRDAGDSQPHTSVGSADVTGGENNQDADAEQIKKNACGPEGQKNDERICLKPHHAHSRRGHAPAEKKRGVVSIV